MHPRQTEGTNSGWKIALLRLLTMRAVSGRRVPHGIQTMYHEIDAAAVLSPMRGVVRGNSTMPSKAEKVSPLQNRGGIGNEALLIMRGVVMFLVCFF